MNHEHFLIGGKAFGAPHHLALVFVVGRREGFAFLKREFPGVLMDHGGLDLSNLEGFMPFRCPNLPDQSDPLTRP
jgi:hypothetical protein